MLTFVLEVGIAIALGIAFYKHHTLSAVVASAKKEIANVEALIAKDTPVVKADITAAIAKLKAVL